MDEKETKKEKIARGEEIIRQRGCFTCPKQAARRAQEDHDRWLEDYGIETKHKLAEIHPENYFEYSDQYVAMKFVKDNKDNSKLRSTSGIEMSGSGLERNGRIKCTIEQTDDMKHMIQADSWKPHLIGKEESPYVLSEEEKDLAKMKN